MQASGTDPVERDDPETWDEDRLREELTELHRAYSSAAYERDKYDRRRGAYAAAVDAVLRSADVTGDHVTIPLAAWESFTSDVAEIRRGRIPGPRTRPDRVTPDSIPACGQGTA